MLDLGGASYTGGFSEIVKAQTSGDAVRIIQAKHPRARHIIAMAIK